MNRLLAIASPLALSCFLISANSIAEEPEFAHFLEPGFPFAEITVDARNLGEGFPKDNLTPRGLVVRLGADTYIAYDTDLCRVACAWQGGFLTEESLATMSYHKAKKKKGGGQKILPQPVGKPIFANGLYPGVQFGGDPKLEDPRPAGKNPKEIGRGALPDGMAQWQGIHIDANRVTVNYSINGARISEKPWSVEEGVIGRQIYIRPVPGKDLSLILGTGDCLIRHKPKGILIEKKDGINYLKASGKSEGGYWFSVLQAKVGVVPSIDTKDDRPPPADRILRYWQPVVTRGELAEAEDDYVVDTIPLPIENSARRNIRPSGIDFFPDGRAAIVTYDGDVWIVSGLDAGLEKVVWQRFAGGLHEPNSIRVGNDGEIFVFGRNGVTVLDEKTQNLEHLGIKSPPKRDEVAYYKNFCSKFWQSAETRDFAHSMAVAGDGSFFISKGGQQNDLASKHSGRVLKISPDGKDVSVFASGLRNTYIAMRPGTDEIYASDQQGHWVPASPIHRIVEGGYYGFKPAAPWGVPEPEITPPLCWIPHAVAGSGIGPVWADKKRFGPLSDSLVYLDFQRPGLLRTYLNDREGQAATVPMPTQFDFPLLKGAVNPVDGQLYVVGFQIWGTSAKKIRGMARVRYTGKPSVLPERVIAGKNAIVLRFGQELDPSAASFTVRRWNYKRTSGYGSGHHRPDGKAGEEILEVGGSRISADGKSVLIAVPDQFPVQQLAVSYDLKTKSGHSFSNAAYLTLHQVSPLDLAAEGFADLDLAKLVSLTPDKSKPIIEPKEPTRERGAVIHQTLGCAACHSIDGSTNGKSGPTWKNLAGSTRTFIGGDTTEADGAYLRESILDPAKRVTKGYNPKDVGMPSYRGILTESDIDSLVLYIQSLE